MSKFIFKVFAIFIIGVVGGIFADQIFWPYFIERPLFLEYNLEQRPVYLTEHKEITIQDNTALQESIKGVEKIIVGIKTETKKGKTIEGSGLIITSDGLVVTLAELVPANSSVRLFLTYSNEEITDFQIIKRDLENNLALIKIEKKDLNTAGYVNLEELRLGQRVFAVTTLFDQDKNKKTLTISVVDEGIIQYLNQGLINTNISGGDVFIGSPLFNIEGNVLGINFIDKHGKMVTMPYKEIQLFTGI